MIEVTVQEYRSHDDGTTERTFEVDGDYMRILMKEATEAILLIENGNDGVVATFKHWVRANVKHKMFELPNAVGDGGDAGPVHVDQ